MSPIYIYVCPKCGDIEKIVRMGTKSIICPACRKPIRRKGVEVPARRNPEHGIQR